MNTVASSMAEYKLQNVRPTFRQNGRSTMIKKLRRRATCIVEQINSEGELSILIAEQKKSKYYLLPGGRAEKEETSAQAAIRELREETHLKTTGLIYLFEHHSTHHCHKVFYIHSTYPKLKAKDDVKALHYLPLTELDRLQTPDESNITLFKHLSHSTKDILCLYRDWRKKNHELLRLLSQIS